MMKLFALSAATLLACAPAVSTPSSDAAAGASDPALVVLITVDQLRGDYIDRWAHQLTGGLARLAREGAYYPNAFHDHAITETAPGHASLSSGRFPVNTGIAANAVGVYDQSAQLLEDNGPGASPRRFQGTTIADWIAARHPSSRMASVSGKDRGAILPIGRRVADVYWYMPSGRFTTSTYYRAELPAWVREFNARRLPQSWAGRAWTLLLDESAYPEPDSVPAESNGQFFLFPHVVPPDPAAAAQVLPSFPWLDDATLEFALAAVRSLELGRARRTDLLAVSLSATDYIGHRFGPDSRELHDNILRLDRSLGTFFDTLFTLVDQRRVVIALSSDHGVAPLPELAGRHGAPNARRVMFAPLVSEMRRGLAAAGADSFDVFFGSGALSVNRAELTAAGVNVDSTVSAFGAAAALVPGVAWVTTMEELARRDRSADYIARRWLNMFRPGGEVPLVVTLEPYSIWGPIPATHGSPHDYDAHVPVIFWGEPFRAGRHDNRVRVVDLAPTLARAARVQPSERVDGRVLVEALR
ncbi:MAG TPA: alkaline phosphatase family protein [Gemmatimonadaceae bacterium]|nr:alkaline phosphatase family protein [Gemmatimonadaceae bacterium]